MRRIDFVIKNVSPVNFSEKSVDSIYYATKRFIPGSALRGALANRYIACENLTEANTDPLFRKLFLTGEVQYLPAYPTGNLIQFDVNVGSDEHTERYNLADIEPFVLPFSLMKNKQGTLAVDLATGKIPGAGFKKLTGFAVRMKEKIYKVEPSVQISFHMSRNDDRERFEGTSIKGHIYNYEYLEPHQFFKGSIYLKDSVDSQAFDVLLKLFSGDLRLGRSKNAEYGTCRSCIVEEVNVPESQINSVKPVYLYALTPYIPYGEWQNAEEAVTEAIQELAGRIDIKIEKTGNIFAVKDFLDGFVGVWHAKRATVPVLSAGSLFGVTCDDTEALAKILVSGVGQRTQEGFGQFRLWQPLTDVIIESMPEAKVDKPEELPEEIVKRVKQIIRNRLLTAVQRQAEKDARPLRKSVEKQGKHICKRIEHLMDSTKTQAEIEKIIRTEFKKTAQTNLKNLEMIYTGGRTNLLKIFNGELRNKEGKSVMPYEAVRWEEQIGITAAMRERLERELKTVETFMLDSDELFRQYWLWVMRHAVKQNVNDEKPFNTQFKDQLNKLEGGEA